MAVRKFKRLRSPGVFWDINGIYDYDDETELVATKIGLTRYTLTGLLKNKSLWEEVTQPRQKFFIAGNSVFDTPEEAQQSIRLGLDADGIYEVDVVAKLNPVTTVTFERTEL